MYDPHFYRGREQELNELIAKVAHDNLDHAACAGVDPDIYHPEQGRPSEAVLARCAWCPARLACLALAMRAEDPDARAGWYGGTGPADRQEIAAVLGLDAHESPVPDRAMEAAALRAAGWTVNRIATQFGCSDRTVQRYLRSAARSSGAGDGRMLAGAAPDSSGHGDGLTARTAA